MPSDGGQCLKMSFWTFNPLGVDATVVSSLVLSEFSCVCVFEEKSFWKLLWYPQMIKFDMATLNIPSFQTHYQLTIHEVVIICLGNGPWKWYSWSEGEPSAVGMTLSLVYLKEIAGIHVLLQFYFIFAMFGWNLGPHKCLTNVVPLSDTSNPSY